jgi:hypothetical protein
MRRPLLRTLSLLALVALCATSARSEGATTTGTTATSTDDSSIFSNWDFQVAPYLWLFFVDGDVGAGGKQTSVSTNFADVLEHVDSFVGIEVNMQARNGPWTVVVDPTWLRTTSSFALDKGPARVKGDVTSDLVITDALVMRELFHVPFGAPVVEKGMPRQGLTLDAVGGMRATIISGDLDLKVKPPGELLNEVKRQWDSTQSWVDPVIGARATVEVGRFTFLARGDVGGFTIASDITSEMWATALYNFKVFGVDAFTGAAFRAIYDDYDADHGFLYKTWVYGPVIGMGFRF